MKISNGAKAGVGAGVGAVLAAAAGAYYLFGTKEGAKKRVKIKGWALKAKAEVLEQLEQLKDVNEKKYHAVVSEVVKRYRKIKKLDPKEIETLAKEMKAHWKNIHEEIS